MILSSRFAVSVVAVSALVYSAGLLAQVIPAKITHVDPVYPEQARQARIQGTVVVQVTVGTDGRVSNARVLRSIPMLDQAALDAVRQWVYDARAMSAPVTLRVTVPFGVSAPAATIATPPLRSPQALPPARTPPGTVATLPRMVAINGDLLKKVQAFAQSTTRRIWGIRHERLFIQSNRAMLASFIVRNDPKRDEPLTDTVSILCGDDTLDLQCVRVRVTAVGKEVAQEGAPSGLY
jgi:TonB family protein